MKDKKIIFILSAAMSLAALTACGGKSGVPPASRPPIAELGSVEEEPPDMAYFEPVEKNEAESIRSECAAVLESYQELYFSAAREYPNPSDSIGLPRLTPEGYEEIFNFLSANGVPILRAAGDCFDALIQPDSFYSFWEKASKGENSEFTAYALSEWGNLYCYKFICRDGEKYSLETSAYWEDESPTGGGVQKYTLDFWLLTDKGNFLYGKQHAPRWMGNSYGAIHMGPVDGDMNFLARSYIDPVGYQANNLFLTDWSEEDWGELNFNDLFEFIYRLETGSHFLPSDYEMNVENYCYYLDASLFEPIMQSRFAVSADTLRGMTLYDEALGGYPWQSTSCNNYIYNSTMTPDIRSCRDNGDGTLTLEIEVVCPERKTDCLFKHLLTVRSLSEGGFQYVSNEMVSLDESTFPLYYPRIEAQRQEQYKGRLNC